MKIFAAAVVMIIALTACGQKPEKGAPGVTESWSTSEGLKVPESVMYDSKRDCLYVSNINGKPTEKNSSGFIAKLSLDGKVMKLKWAVGMNAPKGMAISGETLYVSDIDRIHGIDINTGKIKETITRPDATFLNDLAVCSAGNLYVSDMDSGKVFVLKGKALKVFVDLSSFKGSNGMFMKGHDLLVGSKTGIVKVDLSTKKATLFVPVKDYGMIDGLKAYSESSFLMSNWQGRVQQVDISGKVTLLFDTSSKNIQAADFEYIPKMKLLLVPTFFNNRVVAYTLN